MASLYNLRLDHCCNLFLCHSNNLSFVFRCISNCTIFLDRDLREFVRHQFRLRTRVIPIPNIDASLTFRIPINTPKGKTSTVLKEKETMRVLSR